VPVGHTETETPSWKAPPLARRWITVWWSWYQEMSPCQAEQLSTHPHCAVSEHNKTRKLSRCWDSATCNPLDVAKMQNSTFSMPHCSSSVEFWITGYYNPGRLRHAGSQDNVISCHMSIYTFCCTAKLESINVADTAGDGCTSPVSAVSRRKLLSGWALQKLIRTSISVFWPYCPILNTKYLTRVPHRSGKLVRHFVEYWAV